MVQIIEFENATEAIRWVHSHQRINIITIDDWTKLGGYITIYYQKY